MTLPLPLTRPGKGYAIDVRGSTFDARSLIKGINTRSAAKRGSGASVAVSARLQKLIGFGNETLRDVTLKYSGTGSTVGSLKLNGVSRSGTAVSIENTTSGKTQTVAVSAKDAGAFLRFLNIYERAQGRSLSLSLSGQETLRGRLDLRNFVIVDEPRLGSLVSSRPPGGDRSLESGNKRRYRYVARDLRPRLCRSREGRRHAENRQWRAARTADRHDLQGTVYDRRIA